LHQRLHRHGDSQIGLPGSRRPNAKNDISLLNRFDVLALHRGFWRYLFLACRAETRPREIVA
jgi:hypothetical protein